ncbi:MAG TPA: hypothetical protein VGX96_21105 [Candidatus Elarobacter sp.]|jgi:hypothetical protein|nr:hypothetical protein [Candidatus Elarobacter sp.]
MPTSFRPLFAASALAAATLLLGSTNSAFADDAPAQRHLYHFTGSGGRELGPLQLSGTYLISVYARFLPYEHPASQTECQFAARFDGLDRAVAPELVDWGTPIRIASLPSFHKQRVVELSPGRYVFHISQLTGCAWDVLFEPYQAAARQTGPPAIYYTRVYVSSDQVTAVHLGQTATFGVFLEGDPALLSHATGAVSLVQGGHVRARFPLNTPRVTNDGLLHFLATDLAFDRDPKPLELGTLTLRFDVTAGGAHLSQSLDLTLDR